MKDGGILINYVSPTMLVAGISLLIVFSRLKFRNNKIIMFISHLTFGVYLIHTQPFVFQYILKDRFICLTDFNSFKMLFMILVISFVIFMICLFIEFLRLQVFKCLKTRDVATRIEKKYLSWANKAVE